MFIPMSKTGMDNSAQREKKNKHRQRGSIKFTISKAAYLLNYVHIYNCTKNLAEFRMRTNKFQITPSSRI